MDLEDLVSLQEAAALLELSPDTLRTQWERGRFHAKLVGRQVVTTRQEVDRYRAEQLGRVGRPPSDRPRIVSADVVPDTRIVSAGDSAPRIVSIETD